MKQDPSEASGIPADPSTVMLTARPEGRPTQCVTGSFANPDAKLPYEFRQEIARGGMGRILEAQDRKLGRMVAVKIMLLEKEADPDQRQRFINEAAVLATLEHPNIVPIHDLGRDAKGQLFYAMKLVQGHTLQAILDGVRDGDTKIASHYTLDRLLTVFRKMCDALAFAHARGIIHRDLKPENVMVGEFGEVLVMDWGLAKVLNVVPHKIEIPAAAPRPADASASAGSEETVAINAVDGPDGRDALRRFLAQKAGGSSGITLKGEIMGTPQYMSPEQAQGHIAEMDARSDVFSLGGILYAILTLRPPVEGSTLEEVLRKVSRGHITPPSTFGTGTSKGIIGTQSEVLEAKKIKPLPHCPGGRVPAALSAVAMKALSVQRGRRYQDVAALSTDVEAYQGGFATGAENAGAWRQLMLLMKRHKGVTASIVILLLASAGFMLKVVASERKATRNAEIATANEQSAKAAEAVAVRGEESTRQALAKSALALAEAARREGNGPEMQAALNEVPEDLRDTTWHYLLDQSDTSIARVRTDAHEIMGVAAHPRRPGVFAVSDNYRYVTLIEVRTGIPLLKFYPGFPPKTSGFNYHLAFSPDGERIAVGRDNDGGIVIHNARNGVKLQEWAAPGTNRLEFSADGSLLLQTDLDSKILNVWDTATGQLRWKYESSKGAIAGTFTPDGQMVLTYAYEDHLRLVNAQDGSLVRALGGRTIRGLVMAIRPDGKMAVIGEIGGWMFGVDLQDGREIFTLRPHDRRIDRIAFTPDGACFVSVTVLRNGRQAIQVWDANNGLLIQSLLGGNGTAGFDASVHPLSGELLVGGPNARVWNILGTPEKWILRLGNGQNPSIAFWGSDDVVFAPGSGDFPCVLQKLQAGSPAPLWTPADQLYNRPTVSGDGRIAAVGWPNVGNDFPVVLLRNPGMHTEQFASIKLAKKLNFLRLSPTGDRLVAVEDHSQQFELYDTATGTRPVRLDQKEMMNYRDIAWLNDRQWLLGLVTAKEYRGIPGSEECIVLWDAVTGKIIRTEINRTVMDVLAVSPDGSRFAEAGEDKMVRIRNATTLAVQQEFRAHDGPITAMAWHPTMPILATASADLSIKLWNLETGRRLEEFRGPAAPAATLAFSPSGRRLGCAARDSVTRIWEPQSLSERRAEEKARADDGWEDSLTSLTPTAVERTGSGWRMDNGVLSSPNKRFARLPLPGNLSGTSYHLRVKLRQLTSAEGFHLNLPVADRIVGFELDGFPKEGHYTGLLLENGKRGKNEPGTVHGKQVRDSEQHELEVTVRTKGTGATMTFTLDTWPLYEWTGPIAALSQLEAWKTPSGAIALGAAAANWVVYEVKVKRLED